VLAITRSQERSMEGPSLVIFKEDLAPFVGTRVMQAGGSMELGKGLVKQTLRDVRSWGKHALLFFDDSTLRIHFLMFGSYRIDGERPDRIPKLQLQFKKGTVNFYSCAIRTIEADELAAYDESLDLMSEAWDGTLVAKKVKAQGERPVCDVLMDQDIFAGLGNIIKNEVLFRLKLHPEVKISELGPAMIKRLVQECHDYSWQFYHWKKAGVLKKNWKIFRKRKCPDCGGAVTKEETGRNPRVSHYCPVCQSLEVRPPRARSRRRDELGLSPA
jgi:endonuclease-8